MKLWQLESVVRVEADPAEWERILAQPRWAAYAAWFRHFDYYVKIQNRSVLDAEVDPELVRALLALSKARYRVEGGTLRKAGQSTDSLSAVEVFERYGGDCLEETQEFGSYRVE